MSGGGLRDSQKEEEVTSDDAVWKHGWKRIVRCRCWLRAASRIAAPGRGRAATCDFDFDFGLVFGDGVWSADIFRPLALCALLPVVFMVVFLLSSLV